MSSRIDFKLFALTLFSAAGLTQPALAEGTAATAVAPTKIYQSIIPMLLDNRPVQNVTILIGDDPGTTLRIDADGFLGQLKNTLDPKILDDLKSKSAFERERAWLKLQDLNDAGLDAKFDAQTLELKIAVPSMLRKVNRISITREAAFNESEAALEPSAVSAYLNANAAQDVQFGSAVQTKGRQPLRSEFDAAMNLKNWILEGNVGYVEPFVAASTATQGTAWRRGDVRVVRDQPARSLRMSLGDVIFPTSGFQRYQPIGGAAVVTNFSLQPYRTFTASSNHEIVLKSRSRVRLFINGRPIQTLDLPAGRHDLRDFPFIAGVNNVKLEITDDVGRVETVTFPYVYSDLLLEPGVHQVSYAVGAPSFYDGNYRRYIGSQTLASLSHRYGLNSKLTYGAYLQANRSVGLMGASLTFGNFLGTFTTEAVGTRNALDARYGAGLRFAYLYTDYMESDGTQRTFGASLESKSPGFAMLTDRDAGLTSAYNLNLSYSQQLFSLFSVSTTWGVPIQRNTGESPFSSSTLSIALARNWGRGIETTLNYLRTADAFTPTQSTFFFLLNWAIPNKNQYVTASANTQDGTGRMEWNYNPTRTVGSTNVGVGVDRSPTTTGADLRVEHQGNRARVGLNHDVDFTLNGQATHRSSLRAGAALVMADGHFGVSRPVTDSFALVRTVKDLSSEPVQLNPQANGSFEGRADFFGPGIIPDLVSYRRHSLHAAAPDAPIALGFTEETYSLQPTYRSGTVITLGRERSAFVRGKIHRYGGEPLSLGSGELRALDDKETANRFLFTNRAGEFSLESMRPGRYEIQFYDESLGRLSFEIPKATVGVFDAGILILDPPKEKP